MFFRKNERKSHNMGAILLVGALATVGTVTVVKYAQQVANDTMAKVKGFLKKESCKMNMTECDG